MLPTEASGWQIVHRGGQHLCINSLKPLIKIVQPTFCYQLHFRYNTYQPRFVTNSWNTDYNEMHTSLCLNYHGRCWFKLENNDAFLDTNVFKEHKVLTLKKGTHISFVCMMKLIMVYRNWSLFSVLEKTFVLRDISYLV